MTDKHELEISFDSGDESSPSEENIDFQETVENKENIKPETPVPTVTDKGSVKEPGMTVHGRPRKPFVFTEKRKAALEKAQEKRRLMKQEKEQKKAAAKRGEQKRVEEGVLVGRSEIEELRAMILEMRGGGGVVSPAVVEPPVAKKEKKTRRKRVEPAVQEEVSTRDAVLFNSYL